MMLQIQLLAISLFVYNCLQHCVCLFLLVNGIYVYINWLQMYVHLTETLMSNEHAFSLFMHYMGVCLLYKG